MKEYTTSPELTYDDLPDLIDIVGISFRTAGKIYYFASNGVICKEGEHAIVETARGAEYGIVALGNHMVPKNELILPLRSVIRVATPEDDKHFELNAKKEEEAFEIALKKISEHKLDMKLVDVEYTFDNSKLLFYFTADDRVDFRELVKDLASVFRTRIELRQIGIRDEAKMMGGLGICGREFCCHSFLGDFTQVTIKMAKEQNLSLNASKISGTCGKLMCCLRFEHESYQQEIALTPKVDAQVTTPDGPGVVVSNDPLKGICNVRLNKTTDGTVTPYHRDLLNRPENPTTDVIPSPVRTVEKPKREDVPKATSARNERGERTERAPKQERMTEPAEKIAPENAVKSEEKSERSENRNFRPAGPGKGDRNKKRTEYKPEPKVQNKPEFKSESKPEYKPWDNPSADFALQTTAKEKGEHPLSKHHRPQRGEKKTESKFDVKFAGGELPSEPKSEPKTEVKGEEKARRSNSSDYKSRHRRPQHSENKSDKKV